MNEPITVDRRVQRRLQKRLQNERRALRDAVQAVLGTEAGRRVLEYIVFTICQRDSVVFRQDARLQAFLDGTRNAGFSISAELRLLSPAQWLEVETSHLRRIYAGSDEGNEGNEGNNAGDERAGADSEPDD